MRRPTWHKRCSVASGPVQHEQRLGQKRTCFERILHSYPPRTPPLEAMPHSGKLQAGCRAMWLDICSLGSGPPQVRYKVLRMVRYRAPGRLLQSAWPECNSGKVHHTILMLLLLLWSDLAHSSLGEIQTKQSLRAQVHVSEGTFGGQGESSLSKDPA